MVILYILLGLSLIVNIWCVIGIIELCKTVNIMLDMFHITRVTLKGLSNKILR